MNFKFEILNLKFIGTGYLISIVGLFLYSFTQVDLNLTLSEWSIWQIIQKYFQHIGYFQRPLSAVLYISIVLLLFLFYFVFLILAHKRKITKRQAWFLILGTTAILTFSYNAFSYDLFNYIFDAKIVTYYGQNPYEHKALDYIQDPMLSFMHWTHRTYPYGPIWLILTIPLSFFVNFFLPTFFMFKILIAASFLGAVFFIGKILNKVYPHNEIFGIVFFALNPLVIIESLVSSHNDIVMIFFALWAMYIIMHKKYIRSFILLILSIGIKFATVFIIPVFLLIYFFDKEKKKLNLERIFILTTLLMMVAIILASNRTDFQPWYLLYVLSFTALIAKKYYFFIPSVIMSSVSLFQYLPFLYIGDWDEPIPSILSIMTFSSILLSLLCILFFRLVFLRKK